MIELRLHQTDNGKDMPRENTTALYTLIIRGENGETEKVWSHSKLELIHLGQTAIQEKKCTAKVYSIVFENYGTSRQLIVKILNRKSISKTTTVVWQGKTKEPKKRDVLSIEPITQQVEEQQPEQTQQTQQL